MRDIISIEDKERHSLSERWLIMGQFSWIYSNTNTQLIDNKYADTYLLVPKPFQEKYGKAIYESCYDGYGNFDIYDVYELIAEWNKEMIPEIINRAKNGTWHCMNSWKIFFRLKSQQPNGNLIFLWKMQISYSCCDIQNSDSYERRLYEPKEKNKRKHSPNECILYCDRSIGNDT